MLHQRGFTIIEILAVIVIMGIMAPISATAHTSTSHHHGDDCRAVVRDV